MDTCERDLGDAQKEKDDASVNERMFSRLLGMLTNLRLPAATRNSLLCDKDIGGHTTATTSGGWGCPTNTNGHLIVLLNEARTIQDKESARIEKIHKWCNQQRDIYSTNIRNAKSNLAQQNVELAGTHEEERKTQQQ